MVVVRDMIVQLQDLQQFDPQKRVKITLVTPLDTLEARVIHPVVETYPDVIIHGAQDPYTSLGDLISLLQGMDPNKTIKINFTGANQTIQSGDIHMTSSASDPAVVIIYVRPTVSPP